MNRKKYLALRAQLLGEAQELLNAGKLDELKAKKAEIEKLDADFEASTKEQANLEALKDKTSADELSNFSVDPQNARPVGSIAPQEAEISYEEVFSKVALKHPLNAAEIEVFNRFNPENVYTHTTENTEIMIPKTVVAGITDTMKQLHPILADARSTHIKGVVKYVKHTAVAAGDAAFYDEATKVADEENKFGELTLGAKELAKAVTVSWKLQAMAVEEFIPFLQAELGRRMGYVKAHAYVNGKGDAKEPQGVVTAIKAEASTPQKVEYKAATGLTYDDLTKAMAKLRSMYVSGAKIYANNQTVWMTLAAIKDNDGRPMFVPDVTSAGVGRIFGLPVMEEDAMKDGEILIANMAEGYKDNVQEGMKMVTEQHAKERVTDFVGYEVYDGAVFDTKAFAYLVKGV